MNADDVADLVRKQGWSRLNSIGKSPKEDLARQHEEFMARADAFARAFRTSDGEAALALLVQHILLRPLVRSFEEGRSMEQQALYASFREGQNSVVEYILHMIARAAGEPTTTREAP